MNKRKQSSNFTEIQKLLDSDDELPSSYNEDPVPPAYINDNRFNPIIFKWIDNPQMLSSISDINKKQSFTSTPESSDDIPDTNNSRKCLENFYITSGYLSKQDLLCLKCIAGTVSDNIVLWFVDFLIRKDMHSRFTRNFKSCLVESFPCNNLTNHEANNEEKLMKKKYKIVVKV